jgi:ketosteroid isomerase-like protein
MTVAEVNTVAQAFHDGFADQDAAALATLYHEDARFLPPNMEPAEGPPGDPGILSAADRYRRPLG